MIQFLQEIKDRMKENIFELNLEKSIGNSGDPHRIINLTGDLQADADLMDTIISDIPKTYTGEE